MLHLWEKLQKGNSGLKGVGNLLQNPSLTDNDNRASSPWNILKGNISLPAATLSKSTLEHNQSWMQKFSEKFGLQLAPHGKTTMLPELFKLQISSGCWGITLATASQVASAYKCGVKRVILANQLVGACNMDIISTILANSPDFEFLCLVDSAANVQQLGQFFSERKQKVHVLLEYGPMGGRTGIRNVAQEQAVVAELQNWKETVCAVGVEFFEGILKEEKEIREFIQWPLSRVQCLVNQKTFVTDKVIITGAGTSWFDVVAEEFLKFEQAHPGLPLKKILRSGCYLIYDNGLYEKMETRVLKMSLGKEQKFSILSGSLKPALNIWAYVHSVPEPNLAIIGMGKRDAAMDSGYPVAHMHYRPSDPAFRKKASSSWEIFNMMDQHTFLRINENDDLQVGDIVSFNIYHPCTSMDKWRNVLLVDDDLNVEDVLTSEF